MTDRKRYTLTELVAQCVQNAPTPEEFQEWEQAPLAGLEQAITPHAVDVITQAIRVWESPGHALEWLQRPIPVLDHQRPSDLLGTKDGCRQISLVLRKIERGDFS